MFFGLLDFVALPPEINSGRMYTGPGSGPMLAAAAAWDSVGAEAASAASMYESVTFGLLSEVWSGPTATSMAVAATRYAGWLSETAVQAEHSAVQARAAAAAHDTAFTAMVPPPVIAANRSLLASLVATNILGQNTPAIAATELHYLEMWAQDAAAMVAYAIASAAASALSPFTEPPQTTTVTGQMNAAPLAAVGSGAQATVSQLLAMGPHALAAAAAPTQATGPIATVLDALAGPLGPASLYGIGGVPYLLAIQCVLLPMNGSNVVAAVARAEKAAADGIYPRRPAALAGENLGGIAGPRLTGSGAPSISANLGGSGSVGRLSVPQNWTAAAPAARTAAIVLPGTAPQAAALMAAEGESGLMSDLALGSLAGRAIGATGGAASNKIAGATGSVAASKPSTATIIVIPPSAED